jgi:TPP-dependent pyruvate/acetoin dehydrogenase alpha subunit
MKFIERLRAFELSLQARMPELKCPVHLCLGQEAVSAALHECLEPQDWVFSNHRNHGHYLAKGGSEEKLLDEIDGLETGVNGGFMGSQCIVDPSLRFYAGCIVAGTIGIAVGTALAIKLDRKREIVVAVFGDGAPDEGVFWEAINFAALLSLPILFVCENNGYSVHVPQEERHAKSIVDRVKAFGVEYRSTVERGYKQVKELRQPRYVEIEVTRECPHVGMMEDRRV